MNDDNISISWIDYIKQKYNPETDAEKIHKLLFATKRTLTSSGTKKEVIQ